MDYINLTVAVIVLALCIFFKWQYSYWVRRKIEGPAPLPVFGNYFECFFMQRHLGDIIDEIYSYLPSAKYVAFYKYHQPCILLKDINLIKRITIGDLADCYKSCSFGNDNLHLLWKENVFRSQGGTTESIQQQIKCLFTNEKFSETFPFLKGICRQLNDYIKGGPESNSAGGFEMKDLSTKFVIESIILTALGAPAECFTNPSSPYMEIYKKYYTAETSLYGIGLINELFARETAEQKLLGTLSSRVKPLRAEERRRSSLFEDFFILENDSIAVKKVIGLIEAFQIASNLMAYCFYELSANEDLQSRIRAEIKEILYVTEGELTDRGLKKLFYLDAIMFETLRLHSHIFTYTQKCVKENTLTDQFEDSQNSVKIDQGIPVVIPIYSIHLDSNNFIDPYKFCPERYLNTDSSKNILFPFPGFGNGSQFCLGNHFAFLLAKLGIASIILNYSVEISPKTQSPLTFSKKTFHLFCEEGIWIKFNKNLT